MATFRGGIAVFTESRWSTGTRLRVTLSYERSDLNWEDYDDVVIAGIECASGELRILSPEETGARERALPLPAGTYGLLVAVGGFDHVDQWGENGGDSYELWLWPTDELPQRRLIRGASPGA